MPFDVPLKAFRSAHGKDGGEVNESSKVAGGNRFVFLTDGIEAALQRARHSAGGKTFSWPKEPGPVSSTSWQGWSMKWISTWFLSCFDKRGTA
jgi:hypothetical protein